MKDLIIRAILVTIALLAPFIYITLCGEQQSLSTYWRTPIQPMFLLVNVCVSYFFFVTKDWRIPGILLLLLTCIHLDTINILHNVLAIAFFISTTVIIHKAKRHSWLSILLICSAFFLFKSILWAEIAAIGVICIYHGLLLIEWGKTLNARKNLKSN
jgi:hypothetical protein